MTRLNIMMSRYDLSDSKKKILALSKEKIKNIDKKMVFMIVIVYLVCSIYRLEPIFKLSCVAFTVLILPKFYKENVIACIRLERFTGIVTYLEQMLYSFKKKPKIREALNDSQKVCNEQVKELIEEVLVNIDTKMSDNIYEESLRIIEDEFPARRVKSIHKFIVKVEKQGGDIGKYIDILLNDIKAWNDRTTLFVNEVGRVKRNFLVSIGATLITCGFMIFLIPKEYSYTNNIIYQITTTIMFMIMIVLYQIVLHKLNFDWVAENKGMEEMQVLQCYRAIKDGVDNPDKLKGIRRLNYNSARRLVEKEVNKEFPDWLREIALNLQVETVQTSIENSYDEAPYVLKEPIRKMLIDFEDYPVGIEPYNNFLVDINVPEVKSTMKMLYSMGELGKDEADIQIGSIIDRNTKLENQAESLKNKDKIGIASFLSVIPMFVGVIKIMIDMILMILVFTSAISTAI